MKTITKLTGAMLLGAGAIGLAGCATGFPAQVSRYQAMPAPAGQTFFVVPMDARLSGSLEFQRFGSYVSQAIARQEALRFPGQPGRHFHRRRRPGKP